MLKYFVFFVSIFSLLISEQVEHSYNSAVPSFTKTPDPGRINIEIIHNRAKYNDIYINNETYSFKEAFLSGLEIGNYYNGHTIDELVTLAGINDINELDYTHTFTAINASYHGKHGMGYYASYELGKFKFPNSNVTTTTITAGLYGLWNEIYSGSAPAVVDGAQYTSPTTRILTGFYVNRYDDMFNNFFNVAYLRLVMDFILSNKTTLTNKMDYEILDKGDVFMSSGISKFIYDFNDKASVAVSIKYEQDNQGDNLSELLLEGGYQINNISSGYTKSTLKIVPYAKINIDGKNNFYSNRQYGIKFNLFFH